MFLYNILGIKFIESLSGRVKLCALCRKLYKGYVALGRGHGEHEAFSQSNLYLTNAETHAMANNLRR